MDFPGHYVSPHSGEGGEGMGVSAVKAQRLKRKTLASASPTTPTPNPGRTSLPQRVEAQRGSLAVLLPGAWLTQASQLDLTIRLHF